MGIKQKKGCFLCQSSPCCCEREMHSCQCDPCRGTNPPSVTISMTATPETVCAPGTGNNTSIISGQVLVNGNPAPSGLVVSFSISDPSLGTLIPLATLTNATGQFTATFMSLDEPGVVAVTAALPAYPGAVASIPIITSDCSQTSASITLTAAPTIVCTSGTGNNTSTLTGQVLVNGSSAPGVTVTFTVGNPALGTVAPVTTTTNASGTYSATFTAIDGPGSTTITASLPDFPGISASIPISVVDCSQTPAAINLSAAPTTVCSNGTGNSTSSITGQVLVNGSPSAGQTVSITVSNPALGTVTPVTTTTNASGNFTAAFTAIDGPGSITVTASLPAFPGTTASIPISIVDCSQSEAIIFLTAAPATICASGTGNNTSTLSGQVFVNGSPAPGKTVTFTVSNPSRGIVIPASTTTNGSGNFTASFNAFDGPGTVTVTATLPAFPGTSTSVPITITNCGNSTVSLVLDAAPSNVCSLSTGSTTSVLSGHVIVNGLPAEGVTVSFTVNNPSLGTVIPLVTTTNASGNFTAAFTAIDGPGTVMVTATLPDFPGTSASVPITIIDCSQAEVSINLTASQSVVCALATGENTSFLTGQVLINGSPAEGETVLFSVSNPALGVALPVNTMTNSSGNFFATFNAIDGPGTVTVTASLLAFPGISASVPITIKDCQSRTIVGFSAVPSIVCASGTGPKSTTLSGQVRVNGIPTAGEEVTIIVDNPVLGIVNPITMLTDGSGNFSTTFTAIDGTGTVNATAFLADFPIVSAFTTITVADCENRTISLSANPLNVCSSGTGSNTATLSGQVLVNGSPAAGETVFFKVNDPALGNAANNVVTNGSGNFTSTFFAFDPGTAIVTAYLFNFPTVESNPVTITITDCP